jgi:hypothetical protein
VNLFRFFAFAKPAAAALILFSATTALAAEPVTLRIATSDIYGVANTFPANGDDRVEGVVFENSRFTGGVPAVLAALKAGQIDIAEVGAAGPIISQAAGAEFKIIAVTQDRRIRTLPPARQSRFLAAYGRGSTCHCAPEIWPRSSAKARSFGATTSLFASAPAWIALP